MGINCPCGFAKISCSGGKCVNEWFIYAFLKEMYLYFFVKIFRTLHIYETLRGMYQQKKWNQYDTDQNKIHASPYIFGRQETLILTCITKLPGFIAFDTPLMASISFAGMTSKIIYLFNLELVLDKWITLCIILLLASWALVFTKWNNTLQAKDELKTVSLPEYKGLASSEPLTLGWNVVMIQV